MTVQSSSTPVPPLGGALLRGLADYWWLLLLRGIAAIVFGVLAFAWPGLTLLTLIFLWGAYVLIDGIFALWNAIAGGSSVMGHRWWLAIVGVAGVLAGLLTFMMPGITALVLLFFIAVWSIVIGLMQIVGAFRLRKEIEGEWLLILSGAVSVLFGIVLLMQPGAGALALIWLIGSMSIVLGVIYVALALRLKRHKA